MKLKDLKSITDLERERTIMKQSLDDLKLMTNEATTHKVIGVRCEFIRANHGETVVKIVNFWPIRAVAVELIHVQLGRIEGKLRELGVELDDEDEGSLYAVETEQ